MTATQFILELEKVRDRFVWKLELNVAPGAERRTKARYRVRARPKQVSLEGSQDGSDDETRLDPIGALCFATTEKLYGPGYWPDAAQTLGMSLEDGFNVVSAANDSTWKDPGNGRRRPDAYLQALRRRLMEAVGLRDAMQNAAGGEASFG